MTTITKERPPGLNDPGIGKEVALHVEDIERLKRAKKEKENLTEDERKQAGFDCIITKHGMCGFAASGCHDYILNTNAHKNHTVTINTNWRQGIKDGFYTDTYQVPAGGKVFLGCTRSGQIPVMEYHRSIVGEV